MKNVTDIDFSLIPSFIDANYILISFKTFQSHLFFQHLRIFCTYGACLLQVYGSNRWQVLTAGFIEAS